MIHAIAYLILYWTRIIDYENNLTFGPVTYNQIDGRTSRRKAGFQEYESVGKRGDRRRVHATCRRTREGSLTLCKLNRKTNPTSLRTDRHVFKKYIYNYSNYLKYYQYITLFLCVSLSLEICQAINPKGAAPQSLHICALSLSSGRDFAEIKGKWGPLIGRSFILWKPFTLFSCRHWSCTEFALMLFLRVMIVCAAFFFCFLAPQPISGILDCPLSAGMCMRESGKLSIPHLEV